MAQERPSPKRLHIKPSAAEWARKKLEAEAAEQDGGDEIETKQIALRMPAEEAAFLDAIAHRMKVSRNQAICLLISAGCGDIYLELPGDERKKIRAAVEKALGRSIETWSMRDVPKSRGEQEVAWMDEARREDEENENRRNV